MGGDFLVFATFQTKITNNFVFLYLSDSLMVSLTLYQRARTVGANLVLGPVITLSVIGITGQLLKLISPKFGQLAAREADSKAKLRHKHSRIVTNSEEIAFYGGDGIERTVLQTAFRHESKQSRNIYFAKLWYVFFEQFLMKYVWGASGTLIEISFHYLLLWPTICGN